jgi:alpha-L-fucosidase
MTMNKSWGYKKSDQEWKSTQMLLRNLVDIASKGGNYLLNVGPTAEGMIPEASVDRLAEIGKWMKVNGESIYGTGASPFKSLPWGRCTTKTNGAQTTLYLHVFDWPTDGKLKVPEFDKQVLSASLLATGKELRVKRQSGYLEVQVPDQAPNEIDSVVILKIKGTR